MRVRSGVVVVALTAAVTVGALVPIATAGDSKASRKERATALFVVNASGGTTADANGKDFTLELTGVDPDVLFFTDRPARDSGLVSVARMLELLDHSDDGAPNGVIEVGGGDERGPIALAVELEHASYDAATGVYRADAHTLPETKGTRLEHFDDRLEQELPASFEHTALFIDSSPFGSTNFCETQVQNYTEQNVTLSDQFKWSTDTWDPAPPGNGDVLGLGDSASWQSDGGIGRGCGNSTTWTQDDGTTFHTSISDGYGSAPNSVSCSSSDSVGHPCHLDPNSTTRGASLDVIFYFCDFARQTTCPGQ